jgi:transcriptional regulator with XRE-family HTH domain
MAAPPSFASGLVWWRKKRGLSQLQLAMVAACSQRHISFLELGRTKPSRDMVLRLSAALDLPLRQSNDMLLAAGFAPVWAETNIQAAPLAAVRDALNYILEQQEPYPAVVVDRHWNLLQANKGAVGLVEFLVGPIAPGAAINLADALVGPDLLRPHLLNWDDVVRYFIRSVEADAAADATIETANLLGRLLGYDDVRAAIKRDDVAADGPILAMHFRKGGTELRLFTTITTLGTPQDITLQELRIESFFPMDQATRELFHMWARPAAHLPPSPARPA